MNVQLFRWHGFRIRGGNVTAFAPKNVCRHGNVRPRDV